MLQVPLIHHVIALQASVSRDTADPAAVTQKVWQHAFRMAKSQVGLHT